MRRVFEYDARLEDVSLALEKLARPGSCFVSGSFAQFPLPAVQIRSPTETVEYVHLPVDQASAQRVIAACRLAPYGHGEQTIIDTKVRNTWELNTNEISITNPQWEPFIHEILQSIRQPLGIAETAQVEAKLYMLLVYEEGGKFERHQDSEKEPGMFGTLLVVLPCEFTGGDLVVLDASASKRERHVWRPSKQSVFDVKYAAFYGDCAHEVTPVTSGYRVCLTYNLVTTTGAISRFTGGSRLEAAVMNALSDFFSQSMRSIKRPRYDDGTSRLSSDRRDVKFVYVLEHSYSSQGLRFQYLKNKDHVVAQALAKFCDAAQDKLVLYLARLHYLHRSNAELQEDPDAEVIVTLQHPWIKFGSEDPSRRPDVEVDHVSEVAPAGYLEEIAFHGQDIEYTGNEGTTKSQWYDTAALVIQSVELAFDQLLDANVQQALSTLKGFIASNSPRTMEFAQRYLARSHTWTTTDSIYLEWLTMTERLNEPSLFFDLMRGTWLFYFQPRVRDVLVHFGWDACVETMIGIANDAHIYNRINLISSILHDESDRMRVVQILDRVDLRIDQVDWPLDRVGFPSRFTGGHRKPDAKELQCLLDVVSKVSEEKVVETLATTNEAMIAKLIAPTIKQFGESRTVGDPLTRLLEQLAQDLQAKLPAIRNDAFRVMQVGHECELCHQLQAFLLSDEETQTRLPVKNKTQLKHMETRITRLNRYSKHTIKIMAVAPLALELTKHITKYELLDDVKKAITLFSKMTRTPARKTKTATKAPRTPKQRAPAARPEPEPSSLHAPPAPRVSAPAPRAMLTLPEIIEIDDSD